MFEDFSFTDAVGLIGALTICSAYGAVSAGRLDATRLPYQVMNLAGSGLLLVSLYFKPNPGAIYNVCDDDPAPPQDVIEYAADLLGLPVPPAVAFEDADMTPMARSFYAESKRVRNDRIKDELGIKLTYPDYRTGLKALLKAEPR